jgi:hypothetical protein
MVLLDAEGRVITGKLVLNHGSVVGSAFRIVCQNHDAVAGRRATDHEVARIVVQPPLPPVSRWTEFDAPACAPGELVINSPERLPARIVEPENVGQEAPVIGGGGQKRPVAVKAGFRIAETAFIHAEGPEDSVSGKSGDRHTGALLEVLLEQDEAFAGVAPALARWANWLESLSIGPPVRKPSGVSEHVAYRDIAEDGLIEVLDQFQRQVRNDLLHERRRVHDRRIAIDPNELPLVQNADRPAHASSRYAHDRLRAGAVGWVGTDMLSCHRVV